jgi:O-succinylbenzoic acid--CoA ligase
VSYGSTETASLVALSGDAAIVARPDTAGRALPGCTFHPDGLGVLRVTSPTLLRGYLEGGALRAATHDGTFRTSDRGFVDSEGVLHVTARTDLAFISGGENVDPLEIEAALLAHDAIAEAVVVPVPDPAWGRRPVAFVRTRGGRRVSGEELLHTIDARLPRHARPGAFFTLPESTGIKPDRARLAELAAMPEELERL